MPDPILPSDLPESVDQKDGKQEPSMLLFTFPDPHSSEMRIEIKNIANGQLAVVHAYLTEMMRRGIANDINRMFPPSPSPTLLTPSFNGRRH